MKIRNFPLIFLFLILFFDITNSGKILFYSPTFGRSHILYNGKLVDILVEQGHDVTMVIPEYMDIAMNGTKLGKVFRIGNLGGAYSHGINTMGGDMFSPSYDSVSERIKFEGVLNRACEDVMKKQPELDQLRRLNFDLAITEMVDFCGVALIRYLGIPNHIWLSTTPIHDTVIHSLGISSPPSYVPVSEESQLSPVMTFPERTYNFYMYLAMYRVYHMSRSHTTNLFRSYAGSNFPDVQEIAADSSLVFVNADEFLDSARPILHKTVYIGGIGIEEAKALEEPFISWMQKGKKGVILFSFGTIVPTMALDPDRKRSIFKALAEFKDYHFIMKIDPEDDLARELAQKSGNIYVTEWIPQRDLLGHPRLKLFIMHAGMYGLLEAALRGVPIITIPIFGDQLRNGKIAEYRGWGVNIDKATLDGETLKEAIAKILNDPRYKTNAVRMSKLMKEKPFTPEERFLKWIDFVLRNGNIPELQPEGSKLNFVEYFCLDVIGFLLFLVIFMVYVSFRIIKMVI